MTIDTKVRAYLEAIGYTATTKGGFLVVSGPGGFLELGHTELNWNLALAHSRSTEGMVATHSAKEAWLLHEVGPLVLEAWHGPFDADILLDEEDGPAKKTFSVRVKGEDRRRYWGDSPQAAVEALCRKVLEAQG